MLFSADFTDQPTPATQKHSGITKHRSLYPCYGIVTVVPVPRFSFSLSSPSIDSLLPFFSSLYEENAYLQRRFSVLPKISLSLGKSMKSLIRKSTDSSRNVRRGANGSHRRNSEQRTGNVTIRRIERTGPTATFRSAHRTYVDDPSRVCVRMAKLTIQRIINGRRST